MGGTKALFLFTIFINISGTNGTGEENENDLLFGGMWRKAFELNSKNLTKLNSDQKKEEKPKEVKIEEKNEDEKDDQKMGKSERKIKTEPIFDQAKGKDSDQKNYQKIKKEPKIEQNTFEEVLSEKWHTENDQNDSSNAQKELDQSADQTNKMESEQKKLAIVNYEKKLKIIKEFDKRKKEKKNENKGQNRTKIERRIAKELGTYREKIYEWKRELNLKLIEKFDEMRNDYKLKNNYKGEEDRMKMESEIAKKLGTKRYKIYKWKKDLWQKQEKKEEKGEERKREIIKSFDKMKNEYKLKNNFKREKRYKIEREIAKELGTYRDKIYEWKKELGEKKEKKEEEKPKENKLEIIRNFYKMRNEYKLKNNFNRKDRYKIEKEIAIKLGTYLSNINKWKKELGQKMEKKEEEAEERKEEIIKCFDKIRNEYKLQNDYKSENRIKIESEIAKKLGTYRDKIFEWKRKMGHQNGRHESEETKREIIKKFEKRKEQIKNKKLYDAKQRRKMEQEIAKKLGTYRLNIYKWKRELSLSKRYTTEKKWKIIAHFDKLREEFSNKFDIKISKEIEEKIARKFGVCLRTICNWRTLMNHF